MKRGKCSWEDLPINGMKDGDDDDEGAAAVSSKKSSSRKKRNETRKEGKRTTVEEEEIETVAKKGVWYLYDAHGGLMQEKKSSKL